MRRSSSPRLALFAVLTVAAALAACDKAREPEIVPATVVMPGAPGSTTTSTPAPASTTSVIAPAPTTAATLPAVTAPATGSSLTGGSVSVIAAPPASTTSPSPAPVVTELPSAGLPPRPAASLPGSASIGPVPAASAPADNQPPSVSPGTTR